MQKEKSLEKAISGIEIFALTLMAVSLYSAWI
jgi:hypothetical protein